MSDLDGMLEGEVTTGPEEAPEAKAPPETEPTPAPEPEPEPQPEREPQPEEPKEYESVPLATFLDMRDKAKEANQLRDQLRQLQSQPRQAPPPQPAPDMFEDPEGFRAHTEQVMSTRLREQELGISERFARNAVGEEEFATIKRWALENAATNRAVEAAGYSSDPWGEAVKLYREHQVLSEVGSDPQSYREKLREEILAELQAKETTPARTETLPSDFTKGQGGGTREPAFAEADLDALLQ